MCVRAHTHTLTHSLPLKSTWSHWEVVGMVGEVRALCPCLPVLHTWPLARTTCRLCTSLKLYLSLAAQNTFF